jgi:hypothetical protein
MNIHQTCVTTALSGVKTTIRLGPPKPLPPTLVDVDRRRLRHLTPLERLLLAAELVSGKSTPRRLPVYLAAQICSLHPDRVAAFIVADDADRAAVESGRMTIAQLYAKYCRDRTTARVLARIKRDPALASRVLVILDQMTSP